MKIEIPPLPPLESHQDLVELAKILHDTINEIIEMDDETYENLSILRDKLRKYIIKDD